MTARWPGLSAALISAIGALATLAMMVGAPLACFHLARLVLARLIG